MRLKQLIIMYKHLRLSLLLSLVTLVGFSQVEEVTPPEHIKTITFKGDTNESQLPILRLGEYLILEFDALNGDEEDYYYRIKHFNYNWTPSPLAKAEYLTGMDEQRIRNYENSLNTYQIYSHYKLTIPNKQTRALKQSGNYLMTIYNDEDEIVFTRKFMIYEDLASVGVNIKRSRDVSSIKEKQSVDIKISSSRLQFTNPLETIKTQIIQNNNLNTSIIGIKPQYVLGNQLIYNYTKETSFYAGNEYFNFENKDIRIAGNGVQFIRLKDIYNSYLFSNVARNTSTYTYNPDINGNFLVTALASRNPGIQADYAWVHFSLAMDELKEGQSVHVYGNFNNYIIDDSTKMTYYTEDNLYDTAVLLKQGFYNYKYVIVNSDGTLDEGAISGNFWQTENNYKVLVYYRNLGGRFDKLIGIGETSSVNITN